MDWELRYVEKIEKELVTMHKQLNSIEKKLAEDLERNMSKLLIVNKERHQEYLNLNQRIDNMGHKLDRSVQWNVKFVLGTCLAAAGLIVAVIAKVI